MKSSPLKCQVSTRYLNLFAIKTDGGMSTIQIYISPEHDLNRSGLHLNTKGTVRLATNFINYWRGDQGITDWETDESFPPRINRKYSNNKGDPSTNWSINIDNGLLNGVLFIDLKKAFDTIDHEIILRKLANYGVDQSALRFFIYINDLPNCLDISCPKMFADDTNITVPGCTFAELEQATNSILQLAKSQ